MPKKIILIICLILILLSFIPLSKQKTDNKITIEYSSWGSDSEIRILKPLLHDFEEKNPNIEIKFLHIPQNYFQKLHLLFASNTAPDVIFINNQYLPIYAKANLLEDLNKYNNFFEYDKFYKKSLKTLTYNDKIYAIPRDISNLVIFYNKDLFKKYNIPYPKKNWNFDEFLLTAQKLTHQPEIFGVSFEEEPLFYLPYLTSEGLNEAPYYEKIKNHKGLKFYSDLRKKYHVAPTKAETASLTMAQLFLQGRLGMHLSGRWLVPKYRQDAKFDWDIVEFPKGSSGSVVPMDASGWAISKSSKHKKEALELVKFLSSEECSEKFAQSGLIVPARIDSANSKSFLNGEKPQNAKVFLNVIENSTPTPVTTNYKEILDELKSKNEYLFN